MTDDPQYRLDVTTSDGKYTVRQPMDGAATALRYGKPWPAYEGRTLSNLELALAYELEEARAEIDRLLRPAATGFPMEVAPKDGRMLRLLVEYNPDGDDAAPLDDDHWNEPGWTIGFNTLGDTGDDEWHIAGWCWSHDHFTEGKGTPIAWLPFHDHPASHVLANKFLSDVIMERHRQVTAEGFGSDHDDAHTNGELAQAAACYAMPGSVRNDWLKPSSFSDNAHWYPRFWPWARTWWKPKDRRSDLVRATALLIAEGERIDRADAQAAGEARS